MIPNPSAPFARPSIIEKPIMGLAISVVMGIFALLILRSFPEIDLYFSGIFFSEISCSKGLNPNTCSNFPLSVDPFWTMIREIGYQIPRILMLMVCLYLVWLVCFVPDKKLTDLQAPIAVALSALIGPALITNLVLKEYWGRPRPFTNTAFGGDLPYVAPGTISDFCSTNCSFVSGEASAAFWMLTVLILIGSRKRTPVGILLAALAVFIAFLRVAFGRHYFSDITMSGFIVAFSFYVSVWLVQTNWLSSKLKTWVDFSNARVFRR